MPARPAWRGLSAIVPVAVAAIFGSTLVLAPAANAVATTTTSASATAEHQAHASNVPPLSRRIRHAANIAIAHIGDPYVYGAAGPRAFDCSGLSMFSYTHARMRLPRTAAEQYNAVRHILKKNMKRGDLVFFHDGNGHVYHVAIFLFWRKDHRASIVHAPYPGQVVHRQPVWTSAWYAGTKRP
jgi:cell wall-associated NlpC family hydrolase